MYRGRVFIGDGSPTTLRYYTVMPPNNYIPGIFPGYNCIFTSFGKLHPSLFCPLGPLQDFVRGFRSAYSPTPSLLVFDFAVGALVFAVGASVFASLRFSSSSPVTNRSSPLFASLRLRLWRTVFHRRRLGLRPKPETLWLLSLPSREETLSLQSNCVRAFGRWPKEAHPTQFFPTLFSLA